MRGAVSPLFSDDALFIFSADFLIDIDCLSMGLEGLGKRAAMVG